MKVIGQVGGAVQFSKFHFTKSYPAKNSPSPNPLSQSSNLPDAADPAMKHNEIFQKTLATSRVADVFSLPARFQKCPEK